MPDEPLDPLTQLSDALAARAEAGRALVAAIRARDRVRSGMLWGDEIVLASEQVFPKAIEAAVRLVDGRELKATVVGRDPGTNIVALRLEHPPGSVGPPPMEPEPRLGSLVQAFSATGDGTALVRLGTVRAVGPAWHSLAGGLIDRRIGLDMRISAGEEGGPVFAVSGRLLGMSTAGPRGRGLVIPAATIGRVLGPLLATGRVERGWLGLALHRVALTEPAVAQTGQDRGLMVMQVAGGGPAAQAGLQPGDILLAVGDAPASDPRQIGRGLGPESIGQDVELRLMRAGAPLTLSVTITPRPAD